MLISSSNRDFCSSVSFDTHFSLLKEEEGVEDEEEEEGCEEVKKEVIDLAFFTVVAAAASDSGALRLVFEVEEDIVDLGCFCVCFFVVGKLSGIGWNGGRKRRRRRRRRRLYRQEMRRS